MEAFKLLSRGGTKFNRQRFSNDIELFDATKNKKSSTIVTVDDELPPELDFFRYTDGGSGNKRKENKSSQDREVKRRKLAEDNEESPMRDAHPPRSKHRVTTKGTNVPESGETFEQLKERYNIPSHLFSNLAKNGFTTPTAIQAYGIPIILESRDLAAISPTGTGKTLSYLLPLFTALRSPNSTSSTPSSAGVRALIVAPTRELAHQIHNEALRLAEGRKWRIVLFSKATASTLTDKNARGKVDMIISTPLRLVASLQTGAIDLSNVRHLVLDEADRMLDSEFRPQVTEIVDACNHPDIRKAVFSATLPAGAEQLALAMLHDPIRVVVGLKDTPLPHITQALTYVADDASKLPSILAYLAAPYTPPLLIFTSTTPRATSLASELTLAGIQRVSLLHASLTQKEREDSMSQMRRGETWVLVCTEVMARGIDFRGVREVINYDFPRSVQSYVHRVGRTGRAGRAGKAVTYFTDEDAPWLKSIANVLLQSGSPVPEWMTKLPKPSKLKRRQMGRVQRAESVNLARRIGRNKAVKKRDMIEGSKRRKEKDRKRVESGASEDA